MEESKSRKNNLYTASYFRKRLRESGINADVIVQRFGAEDKRYWIMSVDDDLRVICTCFKYMEDGKLKYYFRFSDGGQVIKFDHILETQSMNNITEYISSLKLKKSSNAPLQSI